MVNIEAEEKMKKARIKLFSRSPFFSYLALFLKFKEDTQGRLKASSNSMGVSIDGTLLYNPDWVNSLSNEECIGVICHEICHIAFLHLSRRLTRLPTKWNVACDLVVNGMLVKNGFSLPKGGLIPQGYNNEFTIKGKTIKDLDKKCAEEVYEELPDIPETSSCIIQLSDKDDDGDIASRFDEHIEGKIDENGNEKNVGSGEKGRLENEWLGRLEEAYVEAKSRGALPNGIERYVDELKKSQVNWRALLQKYLQAMLPTDYSWLKKGKKSYASGFYFPSTQKEKIEVVVSIDTSGSIGKEELTEFVSEIVGIAKAYRDKLTMKVLIHDAEIQGEYDVKNGQIDKIKKIQIKGGGGTSHKPVFEHIAKKIPNCAVLIAFTDGYSDLQGYDYDLDNYRFPKIFVINSKGTTEQIANKNCHIVKMRNY